ncbi:MAG TPA: hypothetical protein VLA83_01805 [Candidatus Binatia bacterium]|nr:hypothetical protein [Candidatus Binatia bacterium]
MTLQTIFKKNNAALCCILLAVVISGCGKTTPQPGPEASPAKPAAQASPTPSANDMEAGAAMLRILNAAHRSGGIMLRGECGVLGVTESYRMKTPVTLEPLDKALQEVSAMHQNIYWRESPASGVRVADSDIKAKLLRLKLREFRVIEDREPDAVMAALWRTPEVTAFLRRNHIHFSRRPVTAKKVISPPMIVEIKHVTVADILDQIAAGYRQDPPKVWIYRECEDKKETLLDVQMK